MRCVTFREVLEAELRRRRERNPRYSLRAFARALALDHSSLSQILRGKRRLTGKVIRRLGAVLRMPAREIEGFCSEANDRALVGLIGSPLFRADSRWIATVLGIPIDEVNVSLQRLVRLRAVVMKAQRTWEVLCG